MLMYLCYLILTTLYASYCHFWHFKVEKTEAQSDDESCSGSQFGTRPNQKLNSALPASVLKRIDRMNRVSERMADEGVGQGRVISQKPKEKSIFRKKGFVSSEGAT